ncbi:hypothetical protein RvVAR031_05110 [Agrobacterium vitis]|nr:hypothetical protein RvVAR031_05110 [Agrobacterium vitis]
MRIASTRHSRREVYIDRIAFPIIHSIRAIAAVQNIGSGSPIQIIVTGIAEKAVIAVFPIKIIVTGIA